MRNRHGDVPHVVSPGTIVYHDARTQLDLEADHDFHPAVAVLTRVVSRPGSGRLTVDAGHKSIAADQSAPSGVVAGHPELVARRPSEEHLPLDGAGSEAPGRGDVLAVVPMHVCPTVNLFDEALLVEHGEIAGVVTVSARGHDRPLRRA